MKLSPQAILFALLWVFILMPLAAYSKDETTCIQCHGNQPGKRGAPVKAWRGSIHEANGISCHDCHGGDAKDAMNAMSPARGFIGFPDRMETPAFCGRCHVGIMDDYIKSAHGRALGTGGPTCVTCHGSHAVARATLEIINKENCGKCHPYEQASAIKEAMRNTERLIVEIEGRIEKFKSEGIDTDSWEKSLFFVRNRYHRLFHEVDTERVIKSSGEFREELDGISKTLAKIDEQDQRRKIFGAIVIGGGLATALITYLLKRTFDDIQEPE